VAVEAVLVVLVEAGDLAELALLDQIIDDQPGLIGIRGHISHMPFAGGRPETGQDSREDVRDLFRLEIILHSFGGRCAQMPHHDKYFIALGQALGVGYRFGRLIDMVIGNQLDRPVVHAPPALTRLIIASMPALIFTPQLAIAPVRSTAAPTTIS
jgi:hypothetical protein